MVISVLVDWAVEGVTLGSLGVILSGAFGWWCVFALYRVGRTRSTVKLEVADDELSEAQRSSKRVRRRAFTLAATVLVMETFALIVADVIVQPAAGIRYAILLVPLLILAASGPFLSRG